MAQWCSKNPCAPPIEVIKSNNDWKSENDCVKIKFHRDPILEKLDMYEFKMALFENVKPGALLLFVRKFKMALDT